MKLLKITTFYSTYLEKFYEEHPGFAEKSYSEQKAALDYDAFGWADFWPYALTPLEYDTMEVTLNAAQLQRAWARENSLSEPARISLKEIALAQVKKFKPEILWFDDYDESLLKEIRAEVPSIKLVLGWVGSAIPQTKVWQHMDLVLSCAPESVERMKSDGLRATQIHHGFDSRINDRLKNREKQFDFSFIGQLIRSSQFHLQRETLLEQLAVQTGIDVFSPNGYMGFKDDLKISLMIGAYICVQVLKSLRFSESAIKVLPLLGRAVQWPSMPVLSMNRRIRPFIKPAVFGLNMFQVLRDSRITLNIHADSSPSFASNMRLFEITGVGTCMVTDWKENLTELFEPDKEIVVYKTADECVEKVKWLLEHPIEREGIAKAAQIRTLKEHTYLHRAVTLDEIIKKELRCR